MSSRPKANKDGNSASSAADGIKKVVTRVARELVQSTTPAPADQFFSPGACDQCRKQKMRCQNADDPPCVRCKSASIPCTFEKPARDSTAIGEAGLERIRNLEMQVSSMSANLFELVSFFRSTNKVPPMMNQSPFGAASQPHLHQLTEPSEQFPQKHPVQGMKQPPQGTHLADPLPQHQPPQSQQQYPGALPSSQHLQHLQLPNQAFPSPRNFSKRQYFHSTVTSAASSDDEEELPSSALVAPIEVLRGLADAAAERHAAESKEAEAKEPKEQAFLSASASAADPLAQTQLPHGLPNQVHDTSLTSKRKNMADKSALTGRSKRKKKSDPPHAYADVVTKGVVSDQTARELFKM